MSSILLIYIHAIFESRDEGTKQICFVNTQNRI